MNHDLQQNDLYSLCRVCGKRVSLWATMTNTIDGCPGVAIPGIKNARWYGPQMIFRPNKNVIFADLTSKCECGAHKLGHKFGSPFHSSWCAWSKK